MKWSLLLLPLCLALRDIEPPAHRTARDDSPVQELFLNVRLDHFHAQNTDTFPMRFYYNDQLTGMGHIVIFVGGEWEITDAWVRLGLAYELAELVHAGLFYTEHRYYGETRPTEDTSVPNLRYLNVDQALGDLAQFIEYVKSDQFENGRYRDGKVVLVGCSYAGSMATWMRLAYPHLVDVVVSDSGPLHAQEDFPEYLEVITEALRVQGGEACLSSVETAMRELDELLATASGALEVSQLFNTCSNIASTTPLDVATFYWFGITETFAGLVQYARPGDISEACAELTDTTVSNRAVARLAAWITQQYWTQPCIETRYTEVLAGHTNTSYTATDAVMRLWTYQTCVEYGWYQTTSSDRQPFLNSVPLEYFHQMCRDFFSTYFDETLLRSGIDRTNILFGGLTHLPDHVLTVQGSHDPWSPMGPNVTHATPLSPVYVVPQVSHCMAIQPSDTSGIPALESVKSEILADLFFRVTGMPLEMSAASHLVPSLIVFVALAMFV